MHFQTQRMKLTNEIRSRSKITSNQLIRVQSSFLDLSADHSYISVVNDSTDRNSDWIQQFRHFLTRNVAFRRVKSFVKISSPLNQMQSKDETPSTEQDNLESKENSSQNTKSKLEPVCEQTECEAEYISERDPNHVEMDKTPQSKSIKDCLLGLWSPTVIHVVGRSPARTGGWNNLKNGNKNAKTEADLTECPLTGSHFEEVAQSKEVIRKYHQAMMDELNSLFKETMEESLHNPETAHDCTKTLLGRLTVTSHHTKRKRGYCGANM
ncbi:hypothetical protein FGIG_05016 [Fasciola gigantica]|uniref:Uncharacterized protein n=1 Tax=Fasciola gigantica TaxID=46835 RepID=A0A504YKG9_FASGI|nr:hypothetical protein FGIG_05016 [Fasciola gigantica]